MTNVICIDGPSGAGKGTVSRLVAEELGFRYLDSGALYRVLAVIADKSDTPFSDEAALADIAKRVQVEFVGDQVLYEGADISSQIRTEEAGDRASQIAGFPAVREALLDAQRAYSTEQGLVADGRDMGTVVFPDSTLKIFLVASAEERARRRLNQLSEMKLGSDSENAANQLIHKDDSDSLRALVKDIKARDERDANREVSPLRPATDAVEIDSTSMSIEKVVAQILELWAKS